MVREILDIQIMKNCKLGKKWISEEFYGKKYLLIENGWVLSFKKQREYRKLKPIFNVKNNPVYMLSHNGTTKSFSIVKLLNEYFGSIEKFNL